MTAQQYAPAVLQAGVDLGITPKGIVIGFAAVFVESNWTMYANEAVPESMSIPHDDVGSDSKSVGLFQQQVVGPPWWWGDAPTCMDPYKSAGLFFSRLAKLDYNSDANSPGSYAQAIQQSAFPDRYDERMADAQTLYDQISGGTVTPAPAPAPADPRLAALLAAKPDFNEYPVWCDNNESRGGTPVDLWLLHTEESSGYDSADGLAHFLISTTGGPNPVSYHYTISKGPNDDGVTVCDCVDTDQAAWAVGNSNARAINLCFAGSSVNWSRAEWITNLGRALDVAAYLAVQDCIKYGIATDVIPGPSYPADPPGISDHRYCTDHLKDGNTHVDVGDNFPWDLFAAAVANYVSIADAAQPPAPAPSPSPGPAPAPDPTFKYPSQAQMVREIWEQLRGPQAGGWPQLGGRTLVDAVAELLKGGQS